MVGSPARRHDAGRWHEDKTMKRVAAIVRAATALTGAVVFATDPPMYRARLTPDQLDQLPLVVLRYETPEENEVVTIAFHVKPSDTVTLSAVYLAVRDANTNLIARVESKVTERHGVPSCIFSVNRAYIAHSTIEFTLDLEKSYNPLMLSLREALTHFSTSKTGDLTGLRKKEWNMKLLATLNSCRKE
jgi:hypothetical protein